MLVIPRQKARAMLRCESEDKVFVLGETCPPIDTAWAFTLLAEGLIWAADKQHLLHSTISERKETVWWIKDARLWPLRQACLVSFL